MEDLHCRSYNEVLGKIIENKKDLTSPGCFKVLVDPKKGVYKGIYGVLSILVWAKVANAGVEFVCESMVSVMEVHTPSQRAI